MSDGETGRPPVPYGSPDEWYWMDRNEWGFEGWVPEEFEGDEVWSNFFGSAVHFGTGIKVRVWRPNQVAGLGVADRVTAIRMMGDGTTLNLTNSLEEHWNSYTTSRDAIGSGGTRNLPTTNDGLPLSLAMGVRV